MNMTQTEQLITTLRSEASCIDRIIQADIDGLRDSVDKLLLEVLNYGLLNGGKRIRPLLVVLTARVCGRDDQSVYQLARAFEYLHAATLFHDDVIDNAETRRGRPAVNRKYGLVAAILAGDFLHARSMGIVGELAGSRGLTIFCDATAGMVDGEFMQLRNAAQYTLSEPDYYEAIMGKTGLLIAAACETGALYGGATAEQQQALRQYGVGLGCAFQMVDDLLDYTGDQEKTGKAVGNDLVEGKMTIPLIITLKRAGTVDGARIRSILADEQSRLGGFAEVVELIHKYEGFVETRTKAEGVIAEALAELDIFDDQPAKKILQGLAQYVLRRDK